MNGLQNKTKQNKTSTHKKTKSNFLDYQFFTRKFQNQICLIIKKNKKVESNTFENWSIFYEDWKQQKKMQ